MAAERGGADRVEVCRALEVGGLSPGDELLREVRRRVGIGVMAMIRPRAGNFCYAEGELAQMREEIARARKLGADGVVLGVLGAQGRVDVGQTRSLVDAACGMEVTFHRALDETADPVAALDAVMETGARRVLTSGGADKVTEALGVVARMVARAGSEMSVMAGSGVRPETIAAIARVTGVREFHASLRPGKGSGHSVGNGFVVSEEDVRALRSAVGTGCPGGRATRRSGRMAGGGKTDARTYEGS